MIWFEKKRWAREFGSERKKHSKTRRNVEKEKEKWQWFKAWGNMFGHFARELIATNHEREMQEILSRIMII